MRYSIRGGWLRRNAGILYVANRQKTVGVLCRETSHSYDPISSEIYPIMR